MIKSRNKISAAFSMSSLTDIIFLLLIFFMLTSSFVSPNAIKLLLPKANGKTIAKQTLNVSVTKDLNYYVDNKKVPYKQLKKTIKNQLGVINNNTTVVLRVDQAVRTQHLVDVLKLGNELNVKMILATKPK